MPWPRNRLWWCVVHVLLIKGRQWGGRHKHSMGVEVIEQGSLGRKALFYLLVGSWAAGPSTRCQFVHGAADMGTVVLPFWWGRKEEGGKRGRLELRRLEDGQLSRASPKIQVRLVM